MTRITTALMACLIGCPFAVGDPIVGQPIPVPDGKYHASAVFVGSNAGFKGVVSLIEAGEGGPDAGEMIFHNHLTPPGHQVDLGAFDAGRHLRFAYEVMSGRPDLFRMDRPEDRNQFAYTILKPGVFRVGVEDIRLPGGDHDYNDMVFDVYVTTIPAPAGTMALACTLPILLIRFR